MSSHHTNKKEVSLACMKKVPLAAYIAWSIFAFIEKLSACFLDTLACEYMLLALWVLTPLRLTSNHNVFFAVVVFQFHVVKQSCSFLSLTSLKCVSFWNCEMSDWVHLWQIEKVNCGFPIRFRLLLCAFIKIRGPFNIQGGWKVTRH